MTPEEKAKELIYAHMEELGSTHEFPKYFFAKEHAKITVQEIIKSNPLVRVSDAFYWINILKAIEDYEE